MAKGLQYIMRLASEGGKQVTATLMSVGETGEKAFKKLDHSLSLSNVSMDKLGAVISRTGVVLAAQAAALAYLTARQMEVIDGNAKMADSFQISYESLTDMMMLAHESGVGFEKLGTAMTALQVKIGDGSKASAEAFRNIGLNVQDLINLPVDQQFSKVAEALSKVENSTLRTTYAVEIFGKKVGRELLNVFDDYGEKLADVTAFNEKFGISLSRLDAAKVEQANDAFGRVKAALMGIVNTIAVQVSPAIEGVSKYLTSLGYDKEQFAKGVYAAMDTIAIMADFVRHAFDGVGLAFGIIKVKAADTAVWVLEKTKTMSDAIAKTLNQLPGVNIQSRITDHDIMVAKEYAENARFNQDRRIKENSEAYLPGNTILGALDRAREESQRSASGTAAKREAMNRAANATETIARIDQANEKTKDLKKTTDELAESAKKTNDIYNSFFDGIIDGFEDGKLSAQEFGTIALRAVKDIMLATNRNGFSISGPVSNSIISDLGSLLSGFLPSFSFATGVDSVPYDMTARIHAREAVLDPQEAEEWRSGRGSKMNVIINNNAPTKVSAVERQNQTGGRELVVQIDEVMAQIASDPGSRYSRAKARAAGIIQR